MPFFQNLAPWLFMPSWAEFRRTLKEYSADSWILDSIGLDLSYCFVEF